ncbi:MAG: hypothetical protein ACRC0M_11340 [Legionella sp.]
MVYKLYRKKIEAKMYPDHISRGFGKFGDNIKYQNAAIRSLDILNNAGLLNGAHADLICSLSKPIGICALLEVLEQTRLIKTSLVKNYLKTYIKQYLAYPDKIEHVTHILKYVQKNKWHSLLTETTLNLLILHPESSALYQLLNRYFLTEAEFALLMRNPTPQLIAGQLPSYLVQKEGQSSYEHPLIAFIIQSGLILIDNQQMSDELIAQVIKHEHAWSLYRTIVAINKIPGLTKEHIEELIRHRNPQFLVKIFGFLAETSLCSADYLQQTLLLIMHHPEPRLMAAAVYQLHSVHLLTDDKAYSNLTAILQHQHIDIITELLELMYLNSGSNIIQQRFELLIKHPNLLVLQRVFNALNHKDLISTKLISELLLAADPQQHVAAILAVHYPEELRCNTAGSLEFIDSQLSYHGIHVIWLLLASGLLSRANIEALEQRIDKDEVVAVIEMLYGLQFFNDRSAQAHFDLLLSPCSQTTDAINARNYNNVMMELRQQDKSNQDNSVHDNGLNSQLTRQIDVYKAGHMYYVKNVIDIASDVFSTLNPLLKQQFIEALLVPDTTYPVLAAFHTLITDLKQTSDDLAEYRFEEDFVLIARHSRPVDLAEALVQLYKHHLLSSYAAQQNRLMLSTHDNPLAVAKALIVLQEFVSNNLLSLDNRWAVGTHKQPENAAQALLLLINENRLVGLNAEHYCTKVLTHSEPYLFASTITLCDRTKLLDKGVDSTLFCPLSTAKNLPQIISFLTSALDGDKLAHNRLSIALCLNKYIQRIESYKKADSPDIAFDRGFFFFSKSRAEHRKSNYVLAQQLFLELVCLPEKPLEEIFSGTNNVYSELFSGEHGYVSQYHSIGSDELNKAIEHALECALLEREVMALKR